MIRDYEKLRRDIHALYARQHAELGEKGTLEHLERGRQWDFTGTLNAGGVLVFPHAGVQDCGYQIAACVNACLDSGADTVLVVSVLHAFSAEMDAARHAVADGADPADDEYWGIQGPGIDGRDEWRGDHVLISWRHFWQAEVKRRGLPESKGPACDRAIPLSGGWTSRAAAGDRRIAAYRGKCGDGLNGGCVPSRHWVW